MVDVVFLVFEGSSTSVCKAGVGKLGLICWSKKLHSTYSRLDGQTAGSAMADAHPRLCYVPWRAGAAQEFRSAILQSAIVRF